MNNRQSTSTNWNDDDEERDKETAKKDDEPTAKPKPMPPTTTTTVNKAAERENLAPVETRPDRKRHAPPDDTRPQGQHPIRQGVPNPQRVMMPRLRGVSAPAQMRGELPPQPPQQRLQQQGGQRLYRVVMARPVTQGRVFQVRGPPPGMNMRPQNQQPRPVFHRQLGSVGRQAPPQFAIRSPPPGLVDPRPPVQPRDPEPVRARRPPGILPGKTGPRRQPTPSTEPVGPAPGPHVRRNEYARQLMAAARPAYVSVRAQEAAMQPAGPSAPPMRPPGSQMPPRHGSVNRMGPARPQSFPTSPEASTRPSAPPNRFGLSSRLLGGYDEDQMPRRISRKPTRSPPPARPQQQQQVRRPQAVFQQEALESPGRLDPIVSSGPLDLVDEPARRPERSEPRTPSPERPYRPQGQMRHSAEPRGEYISVTGPDQPTLSPQRAPDPRAPSPSLRDFIQSMVAHDTPIEWTEITPTIRLESDHLIVDFLKKVESDLEF